MTIRKEERKINVKKWKTIQILPLKTVKKKLNIYLYNFNKSKF